MRRPRPSLVWRVTIGFALAQAVIVAATIFAFLPILKFAGAEQLGSDIAVAFISNDLRAEADGDLVLPPSRDLQRLASDSPGLWFLVRSAKRQLAFGRVPDEIRRSISSLPPNVAEASFSNIGGSGSVGDASLLVDDGAAGPVAIAAGGVANHELGLASWFRYGYVERDYFIALVAITLLSLLAGPVGIPLVLSALRPTARAASSLDPVDLTGRLPEKGVVRELLPIVRAFNSALDRLAAGFERRKRFIADVAHELRTPLAVLNMHIDTLPAGGAKIDLQRTVYRLGQMVGQMLDAERLALAARRRVPVDLVETARVAVADIAPLAVASGYELGLTAASDRVVVQGDPYTISRALANLLGNAIAHGGGSGAIEVRIGRDGRIDVADEGPGVPAEARERIFEPFRRERWDRDGCGLGLHLVREIMHAHGGEASLIGGGRGSIFRLDFAAALAAAKACGGDQRLAEPPERTRAKS